MKRAIATQISDDPGRVVRLVDLREPAPRPGWTIVRVRAAALNQHDLWSIKGVGTTPDRFPMGIASDVAGVTDDGREVLVHSLVANPEVNGGELLDPRRGMLAERTSGGAADAVSVPDRNLVDKPAEMSFETAASLPTAWLTAYRALFTVARVQPGQSLLVQGVGGGVAQALITLGAAAGLTVFATGRTAERRQAGLAAGAEMVLPTGERLPERVDVVVDTVGAPTWEHSVRSARPGGTVVVAGASAGNRVTVDLFKIFLSHVQIRGTSLGTASELKDLVAFVSAAGIRPVIDSVFPLERAADGVDRIASGAAVGKVIIRP